MSDTQDRRSQRSTLALWRGLIGLLQDHDWADITVQMITDRADVARSTFYAHFQTKQDLLDVGFSLVEVAILARPRHEGRLKTVDWLIDHLSDSRGFSRRINSSAAGAVILNRFRANIGQVLRDELAGLGQTRDDATLAFQVGGIFAVIEMWLAKGCPSTPDSLGASLAARVLA